MATNQTAKMFPQKRGGKGLQVRFFRADQFMMQLDIREQYDADRLIGLWRSGASMASLAEYMVAAGLKV